MVVKRRRVLVVSILVVLCAFAVARQSQAQPLSQPSPHDSDAGIGASRPGEEEEPRALTSAPAFLPPVDSTGGIEGGLVLSGEWTPGNTVVLANPVDARFGRDFSTLLKHLRLEWVMLEDAAVPEAARDKNVILVGRLDAEHTGEILRELLTAREIETLRAAVQPTVLEKESPWAEDRYVTVCAGADLIATRDAAEVAVRNLIAAYAETAGAPEVDAWIRTTYDMPIDDRVYETVDRLRYEWEDEELPLADLSIDVKARPRRRVSAAQAAEDVERLFYLFSHAYAGYGFFNQDGAFEQAKGRILEELPARSRWSSEDLARLLNEELGFISDCHLKIGGLQYAGHADFWYDTELELTLGDEGYQFAGDSSPHIVTSIDGRDPESYLYPSLNARGDPIYRLGTLSVDEPTALRLAATHNGEERQFEVRLKRSDFVSYSDDLFREDTLGGIPVIRIRTFSDHHADALQSFVETASAHKGDPALIVDARGNGGGNEAWPVRWIQGLTGQRAESIFFFSELRSQTTLIGRANVMAYMYERYPKTTSYRQEAERHTRMAQAYEDGSQTPNWVGPLYPQISTIANDTTLILVMNEYVASSGEGLIMRGSRLENVVVVGENSMGCLTFGNAGLYQLPHSRMQVHMPINFGLYPDLDFREERGLTPDLWVPAADAVNSAVAAVRSGTITTEQRLAPEQVEQPFVPEDTGVRARQERVKQVVPITLLTLAGSVWAYFNRKRPILVAVAGGAWLVVGSVWSFLLKKPVGYGFLTLAGICLVWGGINVWRARRAPKQDPI